MRRGGWNGPLPPRGGTERGAAPAAAAQSGHCRTQALATPARPGVPPTPPNPAPPSAPPPRSGLSRPVRAPGRVRRRQRRRAEEGAAERRLPEPTGCGEGGGRCGGVGLERGVTQLTGAVRSRAAGAEPKPAGSGSGSSRQRRAASVAVGSGAASRPPPREPGEPAAQSRRQPHHHVPRQQAEKALAGGERYYRPSRLPVPGPGPLLPPLPHVESLGEGGWGGSPVPSEQLSPRRGGVWRRFPPPGAEGRGGGGVRVCALCSPPLPLRSPT